MIISKLHQSFAPQDRPRNLRRMHRELKQIEAQERQARYEDEVPADQRAADWRPGRRFRAGEVA